MLRWCLAHGASIHAILPAPCGPEPGRYPSAGPLLDAAVARASVPMFKLLLSLGAPVGHPLHTAAIRLGENSGRLPMLEYLVGELGIDVDHIHDEEQARDNISALHMGTPLHYCTWWSKLDGMRWLLEHGADVRRENCFGEDALAMAAQTRVTEEARELLWAWISKHGL